MNPMWLYSQCKGLLLRRAGILKNVGWVVSDRVMRMAVGVVITSLVARYLGPERLGILGYAIAWVSLFSALTGLGLDNLVVRDLVRSPDVRGEIIGTALVLRIGAGLVAALLAPLAALLVASRRDAMLLVVFLSPTAILASVETFALWFQSQLRMRQVVLGRLAGFVPGALIRIALVALNASLPWFALANTIETAIAAGMLGATFVWGGRIRQSLRYRACRARKLLFEAWPLFLSSLTVMVYLRIDQVLVPLLGGEYQAGIYGAAVRISELWYVVPTSIVAAAYPAVIAVEARGTAEFLAALHKLFRALTALAYLVGLVLTLGGPWIIRLLFGMKFTAAAPVLAIHVWSGVFVALGTARSLWDTSQGATKLAFYSTAEGAIVNIILNLLLVPSYGAVGSALATLVAYAHAGIFSYFIHPRGRPVAIIMARSLLLI